MDKFLNKECDSNKGLDLLANNNKINNSPSNIFRYEYNSLLRQFKLDIHHKLDQFDPFKKKTDYDMYMKHMWYEYLLGNKSHDEIIRIYNTCGVNTDSNNEAHE